MTAHKKHIPKISHMNQINIQKRHAQFAKTAKPHNLRRQNGDDTSKYTCLLTRTAAHVQTMSPNRTAKILQTHRASHELNGTPLEIFQKGGSHE